jgi:hypothetical protein
MLKQKIMICAFVSIMACSYAQLTKSYSETIAEGSINSGQTTWECEIEFSLCEDGKYELRLNNTHHSMVWYDETTGRPMYSVNTLYYSISEGKYEVQNDTLFLTDTRTHHRIVYTFEHPYCIKPVKTFPFLINKIFTDEQVDYTYYSYDCDEFVDFVPTKIETRVEEFKKENTQEYFIAKGRYSSGPLTMELKNEEEYEISFKFDTFESKIDILLFSGTWKRDGNILYLWDTNFEHQFYGLIREDGIEFLFSRWWNDWVLKKNLE